MKVCVHVMMFFSGGAEAGVGDSADGSGWGWAIGPIGRQSSPQDHLSTHTGGAQLCSHPQSSSGLHFWRYGLLWVPRRLRWVFDQETLLSWGNSGLYRELDACTKNIIKWRKKIKNSKAVWQCTCSDIQVTQLIVVVLFSSLPGSGGVRRLRGEQYRWRYSGREKGAQFGTQLCCRLGHQPEVLVALLRQHVSPQQTGPLTSSLPAGQPQPPQGLSALSRLWILRLHHISNIKIIVMRYKTLWSWWWFAFFKTIKFLKVWVIRLV